VREIQWRGGMYNRLLQGQKVFSEKKNVIKDFGWKISKRYFKGKQYKFERWTINEYCLLARDAVQSGKSVRIIQRILLTVSSVQASESSVKRYNKKHTKKRNNRYAIMFDKAFNPKIDLLTINNNLSRAALITQLVMIMSY
jgi:hypothetical protein